MQKVVLTWKLDVQTDRVGTTLKLAGSVADVPEGRVCLIARTSDKAVTEKNVDTELAHSLVVGSAVDAFRALLTEIYLPSLASQECSGAGNEKSLNEFLQVLHAVILKLSYLTRLKADQF